MGKRIMNIKYRKQNATPKRTRFLRISTCAKKYRNPAINNDKILMLVIW
jgi:hypothetical protein